MMRSLDDRFPGSDTVFDYFVDPTQPGWRSWEGRLPANFRSDSGCFAQMHGKGHPDFLASFNACFVACMWQD